MEITPKLQQGLKMQIFKKKARAFVEETIKLFPKPHILTFPDHLAMYFASLLSGGESEKLGDHFVRLSSLGQNNGTGTIFFMTTADRDILESVINSFSGIPNFFKVFLIVPRQTTVLKTLIANKNLLISLSPNHLNDPKLQVSVFDFPADFLPIGNDFFILPCKHSFFKMNVMANYDDVYSSAKAISKIESLFGKIPHIMYAGANAQRVMKLLKYEFPSNQNVQMQIPQIDSLIIIDRNVDLLTPLITEVNIEGLISSMYDMDYSTTISYKNLEGEEKIALVSENSEPFRTIRMMSLERGKKYKDVVKAKVDEEIKQLKERKGNDGFNDRYMKAKEMMEKLYDNITKILFLAYKSLEKWTDNVPTFQEIYTKEYKILYNKESAIDLVENLVLLYDDWKNALRLMCLEKVVYGKHLYVPYDIKKIQTEIINEFGVEKAQVALLNLEKLRLLSNNDFKTPLANCLDNLDVFGPLDQDDEPANALGTAFGGFIPPSVRFVQRFTDGDIGELSKKYNNVINIGEDGQKPNRDSEEIRRIIVFYVGGITATEAGTIRNIGRSYYNGKVEYIVGSTDKVIYNHFLEQFCPFLSET